MNVVARSTTFACGIPTMNHTKEQPSEEKPAEVQLLPPTNWEDFEKLCLALFRAIWRDSSARQDLTQQGIDILGTNQSEGGGKWGVQCVSVVDGQSISIPKIKQAVAKVDQYLPNLSGLIIAINTIDDGALQQHFKTSTNERAGQGLFPVLVYDWKQLQTRLNEYRHVAKKFYPNQIDAKINWPKDLLVKKFFDPLENVAKLSEQLQAERSVVVHGASGIGKTQLVLQYCHDNAANYDDMWWFRADTASTLLQDAILFCHHQGIELAVSQTAASAMLEWLAGQALEQARWLLVFDNAQDVAALRNFLPPHNDQHHVLVTSQAVNWSDMASKAMMPWPEKETVEKYYPKLSRQHWTKEDVRELVKLVGTTPLGLIHAITFIEKKKATWYDISSLAGSGKLLGFNQVLAKLSQAAQALLGLGCWFAGQPLPKFLFDKNPCLPADLSALKAEQGAWQKTVDELKGNALCIERTFEMSDHRRQQQQKVPCLIFYDLTREAARATPIGRSAGPLALQLMQEAFQFDSDNPESGMRCRALLAHAEYLREHYQESWQQAACFGRLLLQMATYLRSAQGLNHQAHELEKQAYEVLRAGAGEKADTTVIAMSQLADTCTELGELSRAKALQENALTIGRDIWGEEAPQTLTLKINLAKTLRDTNDLKGALTLDEQVLQTRRRDLGDEDPQTLLAMNSLAMTYSELGRLPEARPLQEKALAISRRILGEKHEQTITLMHGLASTLRQMGEIFAAQQLSENVPESTQGSKNLSAATAKLDLAEMQAEQNDLQAARLSAEKALQIAIPIVGLEHHLVWHIKERLAAFHEQDGALTAAQALRKDVVASQQKFNSAEPVTGLPSLRHLDLVHEEDPTDLNDDEYKTRYRTCLQKLKLKEFRCFDELEIDLSEQLTVFIARNGEGKTTVLDALALAMAQFIQCFERGVVPGLNSTDVRLVSTNADLANMEPRYPVEIAVEGVVDGKQFDWRLTKESVNARHVVEGENSLVQLGVAMLHTVGRDQAMVFPVVAYYGTTRLKRNSDDGEKNEDSYAQYEAGFFSRTAGYKDCLDPAANYRDFERWFSYASQVHADFVRSVTANNSTIDSTTDSKAAQGKDGFAALIEAVHEAVDTCLKISGWSNLQWSVKNRRLEMQSKHHGTLPLAQLSDGVRNMVALVADIAQRAVRLNPQFREQAAKKTPGLILIDEVDLHLHPAWQQEVLLNLMKAFPMMQFVVTTHSPQVLTTVRPEAIRRIEWDKDSVPHKATIQRAEFSLGAESQELLKELQGVDPRPPQVEMVQNLKQYTNLIDKGEGNGEVAQRLRGDLDHWPEGEAALAKIDINNRLRKFREGRS